MLKKFRKELNSGTISLVILAVLDSAQEPLYGYQIAKSLDQLDVDGDPFIKQGTLYPVLRAMEKNGLLVSRVEPSVSGPPRRYYAITGYGREVFKGWVDIWQQTSEFVDVILKGNLPAEGEEVAGDDR